jgi:predicted enzyme related to lactoylglutathione lyase
MTRLARAIPILRMYDVALTRRFYVDYLGCTLDWQDGEGDGPVYMQVSRGELVLQLSSHHDDGTPGTAVLAELEGIEALHAELQASGYPFMNPGVGEGPGGGREMTVIDPASNRIRFYERTGRASVPLSLVEFPADDPERARHFWAEFLGTELEPRRQGEGEGWQTRSGALTIGIHARGRGPGDSFSLPYFAVADIAEALDRVAKLGGSVVHPGTQWAICKDCEGSPFGLAQEVRGS